MPDHEGLDHVLDELRDRLAVMPESYREEEIQELRQHLEALVEEHRARGLDETAALAAALDRFGPIEEAARGLGAAYRRRRLAEYVVYAVFMVIVLVPLYLGLRAILDPLFDVDPGSWTRRLTQAVLLSCLMSATSITLDGWAHRRAVRGRRTRFDRYLREMMLTSSFPSNRTTPSKQPTR